MPSHDDIEIRDLTPDRLDDYLRYFESDAFAGNPDWRECYCLEAHFPGEESAWEGMPGPERRTRICALTEARDHTGLLAYAEGRPVAWCHAEPLAALDNEEFRGGRDLPDLDRIGAVVCFNVAEGWRGRGLTGRLLEEACVRFVRRGLTIAEGYPWVTDSSKGRHRNYRGRRSFYEAHGFTEHERIGESLVVRRDLTSGSEDR